MGYAVGGSTIPPAYAGGFYARIQARSVSNGTDAYGIPYKPGA